MNKDQVDGHIKEIKGKVKEVTGRVIGDKTMENKGKLQNAVGKAQAGYGDVKEDIKDAV
ncbi:MAG: CsbD family protein [Lysobacterales bacterium]|nr:CsbD family protein [Xanthomonadales bacterium]